MHFVRHFLGIVSAAAAVAAFVACGDSTSSSSTDPGTVCSQDADAFVSVLTRCDGITFSSDVIPSLKSRVAQLCTQTLQYPGAGYDSQTLGSCISAESTAACRGSNASLVSMCRAKGTLANGAACNVDTQCQSGYCPKTQTMVDGGGTTSSACGTCTASIPVGQACGGTASGPCDAPSACVQGKCVAYGTADVGGACGSTDDVCKDGLACDLMTQTCVALAASGAACSYSNTCQDGLRCANKVCTPLVAAGGACMLLDCAPGLVCDTTNKCAPETFADPGAPCGGAMRCKTGSCGKAGTCPQVIADGQACTPGDTNQTCDILATCTNGVCTLLPAICK